jgi:glycerol-3-phosphate acyltransferase PlsX
MKLIVDTLGFENEIIEAIKACRRIKKEYSDVEFILVGDEEKIKTLIKENEFQIIDAKQAVIMGENPILSLRNQETSMYKSFNALKEGVGDGLISAGSTASFVVIANSVIKKIEGVEKSGFMCFTPTIIQNKNVAFLDVGANLNCSGENLYQFAKMASIYKSDIENITKPKVGVINIGTEKHKGYQYHNDADTMLENDKTINYTGFIEPREILNGTVDIVVCDGYTGNITLKALEGALKSVSRVLKNNFKKAIN